MRVLSLIFQVPVWRRNAHRIYASIKSLLLHLRIIVIDHRSRTHISLREVYISIPFQMETCEHVSDFQISNHSLKPVLRACFRISGLQSLISCHKHNFPLFFFFIIVPKKKKMSMISYLYFTILFHKYTTISHFVNMFKLMSMLCE